MNGHIVSKDTKEKEVSRAAYDTRGQKMQKAVQVDTAASKRFYNS